MSYKYTILSDNPIFYYRSENIDAVNLVIEDASTCNNDAGYTGTILTSPLPLVSGETHGIKITNSIGITASTILDYNQSTAAGGFGASGTSDNDFTLETWFYPSFTTSNKTPIMGDLTENVGLFYENGNITFSVDTEEITYTLPYLKKAYHLVATYSGDSVSLYLDKILVASKSLLNFVFTNSALSIHSGPTLNSGDYFLINGMAAYRYSLSQSQISYHYNVAQTLIPIQVATPDQGELFQFYDNSISTQFAYSYPANRSWNSFLTDDLYFDPNQNSLQMVKGSGISKTVILEDFIAIPSGPTIDSSRIEWEGNNGITVQTSTDGITYVNCVSGQSIPQYKLGSFHSSRDLYIKITMSSTNNSKYLPTLSSLSMSFYNNQKMFAQNSTSYMTTLEGVSGVTQFEINLSNNLYSILSRDARNGLRVVEDSGFYIRTDRLTNTVEFFYTPDALTDSGLISSLSDTSYFASNYSWENSGTISKTNISAIYVNGVNKTSQTNVSNVFAQGELHHVVIVFASPISNNIKFNHSLSGGVPAIYQNIALYESSFDSTAAELHYDLYIGSNPTILDDSSFTVTENSVTPYNNDWLVYQTV
jgi:hypothetical protein